jgi:hypothetical protein
MCGMITLAMLELHTRGKHIGKRTRGALQFTPASLPLACLE